MAGTVIVRVGEVPRAWLEQLGLHDAQEELSVELSVRAIGERSTEPSVAPERIADRVALVERIEPMRAPGGPLAEAVMRAVRDEDFGDRDGD